jgi:hypothetical protein
MGSTYSVTDAHTQLPRLIRQAEKGEPYRDGQQLVALESRTARA